MRVSPVRRARSSTSTRAGPRGSGRAYPRVFGLRRALVAALGLAAGGSMAACGLVCDDVDLSCGGSAVRSEPDCGSLSGTSCSGVEVSSGLLVELPTLADGEYLLDIRADDEAFSCTLAVSEGRPAADCPGSELQPAYGGKLLFSKAPCSVTIDLRDGEHVLATETTRPRYDWDEPWGDGCDWRALASLRLDGHADHME